MCGARLFLLALSVVSLGTSSLLPTVIATSSPSSSSTSHINDNIYASTHANLLPSFDGCARTLASNVKDTDFTCGSMYLWNVDFMGGAATCDCDLTVWSGSTFEGTAHNDGVAYTASGERSTDEQDSCSLSLSTHILLIKGQTYATYASVAAGLSTFGIDEISIPINAMYIFSPPETKMHVVKVSTAMAGRSAGTVQVDLYDITKGVEHSRPTRWSASRDRHLEQQQKHLEVSNRPSPESGPMADDFEARYSAPLKMSDEKPEHAQETSPSEVRDTQPPGRNACDHRVMSDDPYEYIDTTSSINSCGGCISLGSGQDCMLIPGVAVGGVTCEAGKCVVMECEAPWVLRSRKGHEGQRGSTRCEHW